MIDKPEEIQRVRDAIASADGHRQMADNAEFVMGRIGTYCDPVIIKRGWFGTRSRGESAAEYQFSSRETDAICAALEFVRDENLRRANEIEQSMADLYLRDAK